MSVLPFVSTLLSTYFVLQLTVTNFAAATCGKGFYYLESDGSCHRCHDNSYMDKENHNITSCFQCSSLREVPHVVETKNCTAEEDSSITRCEPGHFPGKIGLYFECLRCPIDGCEKGQLECCENGGTTTSSPETTPGQDPTTEKPEISTRQPDNITGSDCKGAECNIDDSTTRGGDAVKEDNWSVAIILAVTLLVVFIALLIVAVCYFKKRYGKYHDRRTVDNNGNVENGAELGGGLPQADVLIKSKRRHGKLDSLKKLITTKL